MQFEDGQFIVTPEEMFTLRQGLFITKYHLDPAFSEDLRTLTGLEREQFVDLMDRIDELQER